MNRKLTYALIPIILISLTGCMSSKHKRKNRSFQMPSFVIQLPGMGGMQRELPRGLLDNNDALSDYSDSGSDSDNDIPNNVPPLNEREAMDGIVAEALQVDEAIRRSVREY